MWWGKMRILAIGAKLGNMMFEIIKIAESLKCQTLFLKGGGYVHPEVDDFIVVASDSIGALAKDIQNAIVTVAFYPDYKKVFPQEIVINASSIKKIHEIIEATLEHAHGEYPITVEESSIRLLKMARKLADTDATILITGATGTGKEVLARYIHDKSNRSHKKFVPVNCAAIPDTLLESELFGYEKGAFTGAFQRRAGKFEEANGGTILLDEISEMSMSLQAKILRIIQEKELSRLGGNDTLKLELCVIATSNKDLKEAVRKGSFREDLFYRLNVIPMQIATLAERKSEIAPLAHFFCEKYSGGRKKLSQTAVELLGQQEWRGNIRELENVIHRSVILTAGGIVDYGDIIFDPLHATEPNYALSGKTLREIEAEIVEKTLKVIGNKSAGKSRGSEASTRSPRSESKRGLSPFRE
jgi:transcriptional regulator with PAS, ATPase and Fis domain